MGILALTLRRNEYGADLTAENQVRFAVGCCLGKLFTHPHDAVTKQYNSLSV